MSCRKEGVWIWIRVCGVWRAVSLLEELMGDVVVLVKRVGVGGGRWSGV